VLLIGLPLGAVSAIILKAFGIGEIDIKIDEDLANYYDACEQEDRDEMIQDEQNFRANYNLKLISDESLLKYQQGKDVPNSILGVHSYRMLCNPEYIQAFQFVPASIPNRETLI
jgi:hypothetical protein